MFTVFAIILVLFVVAFIIFLVFLRKMSFETFNRLCEKKVRRIAKHNNLLSIEKLNILTYEREKLGVHHVVFGKKYIYLITDFLLKGFVSGDAKDNSWVYCNTTNKKKQYLGNLSKLSQQNIQEFAGILGINTDPIISICLVPNECDFSVKQLENKNELIVHYSSLSRKIKMLEKQKIGSLNEQQIYEQFRTIEGKNNEGSR